MALDFEVAAVVARTAAPIRRPRKIGHVRITEEHVGFAAISAWHPRIAIFVRQSSFPASGVVMVNGHANARPGCACLAMTRVLELLKVESITVDALILMCGKILMHTFYQGLFLALFWAWREKHENKELSGIH